MIDLIPRFMLGDKKASCANPMIDPEIFFNQWFEAECVEICKTCPLMDACAQYALETKVADGVWGALTPTDRQQMLKKHARFITKEKVTNGEI